MVPNSASLAFGSLRGARPGDRPEAEALARSVPAGSRYRTRHRAGRRPLGAAARRKPVRPDGSGPVARPAAAQQRSTAPLGLLLFTGALALVHLALPVASLPWLAARGYNEGWNAYHAEAVLSERPLYPAPDELFPNNYP